MTILDQLRRDEGVRASAYQDSLGYWTIGVGTCIDARKGCGLTDLEIDMLLQNRVDLAKTQLEETFPWTAGLDDARLAALLNMTYQMGVHGVSGFPTMLACLQAGDYDGAAQAALDSEWAKIQSPARAHRIAKQLSTGEWT